jgi:hypothetical protein
MSFLSNRMAGPLARASSIQFWSRLLFGAAFVSEVCDLRTAVLCLTLIAY